jgi:RNA polymerase sigma-70 factor (sigma-E family)
VNARERQQFEEFMTSRWPGLVRLAFGLTGDRWLAEDLAQTALVSAYASWWRVRRADDPDAYVRRILINASKSRFRRHRVAEQPGATAPEVATADPTASVDDRSALLGALRQLPPRQRAVVVLRYWEDLSDEQAAELLGCSASTVRSQAARALAKLRGSGALDGPGPETNEPGRRPPGGSGGSPPRPSTRDSGGRLAAAGQQGQDADGGEPHRKAGGAR